MKMTRQEFLSTSGLEARTLDLWLEHLWLLPEQTPAGECFTDIDAARASLILELKNELGANDEGIDIILHLMDQLHGVRQGLAQLRETLRQPWQEGGGGA